MQSDDFLQRVDATKASWGGQSKEQQHTALLTLILEGQMDTIEELGYEGEAGYVRLGRSDKSITYNGGAGQCGIALRASYPQAA